MIAPADLRALGVSPCGCGAVYKRTSRPWICGPGCVPDSDRGVKATRQRGATRATPENSECALGRVRGGDAGSSPAGQTTQADKYRILAICEAAALPVPVLEYRFAPPRRWRFDAAWIGAKVALEVDGGVWSGGRHTRGSGWVKDTEKLNEAACRGWRLLRLQPKQVAGELAALVRRAIGGAE